MCIERHTGKEREKERKGFQYGEGEKNILGGIKAATSGLELINRKSKTHGGSLGTPVVALHLAKGGSERGGGRDKGNVKEKRDGDGKKEMMSMQSLVVVRNQQVDGQSSARGRQALCIETSKWTKGGKETTIH